MYKPKWWISLGFGTHPTRVFTNTEPLTSFVPALLRDPRCSRLLSKCPSAQFISHIHLCKNLCPLLKQPFVNPRGNCSDRHLTLLCAQGHFFNSQWPWSLLTAHCHIAFRAQQVDGGILKIPSKILLQTSWICSSSSSSSTSNKITTWIFRVWHEQDRHSCYLRVQSVQQSIHRSLLHREGRLSSQAWIQSFSFQGDQVKCV